jgi:hypothetical protein
MQYPVELLEGMKEKWLADWQGDPIKDVEFGVDVICQNGMNLEFTLTSDDLKEPK